MPLNKAEVYIRDYLEELRANPALAVKQLTGLTPAPHERYALRGTLSTPWSFNVWGRGCGKTFTNGAAAGIRAALKPGDRIVIAGPSFRQSQLVFSSIEDKMIDGTLLGDCVSGISHSTDAWTMSFRNKSTIMAVPLGSDGSKIRGLRANMLVVDEAVQVPKAIMDTVLGPFLSTAKDPMAVYNGIADKAEPNSMVLSTSAYYTFNHMYSRYSKYIINRYAKNDKRYFVTRFNYKDVPKGFMEENTIQMQMEQLTYNDFAMEWLGEWVSDSTGFFPASLLDSCRSLRYRPEAHGTGRDSYVLGVDPASLYNLCGFVVIKLGDPLTIVDVAGVPGLNYPEICSRILDYMSKFNIVRIGLDAGAGVPVLDLFREGRPFVKPDGTEVTSKVLLPLDDTGREGQRVIQVMPATSQSVTAMNYAMKVAMENGNIKWPAASVDPSVKEFSDIEDILDNIQSMENEFRLVSAKPTKSGLFSYSVPSGKNKDRYSAALFAHYAAKSYMEEGKKSLVLPSGRWLNRR